MDAEREPLRGVQALEGPHAQVLPAPRQRQVGLHGERPRLLDLQLHVQRQRRRHAVEAWSEVR